MGVWGGLAAGVGVGAGVAVLDAVAVAEELALVVGVVLEVALPEAVELGVLVEVGGEWVGDEEGGDDEQPATATEARMAKTPKPMTIRFALSAALAMVTCTVMWTLLMHLADGDAVSQVLSCQTGFEKGKLAVQTANGAFTIEILGYASRRPLGRVEGGADGLADMRWRRIAGFRVVASWPQSGYAAPPPAPSLRARIVGMVGLLLLAGGVATVGYAISAQQHAPQPSSTVAGALGPSAGKGPSLARSPPVSIDIPAIGVNSKLLHLGLNADGSIAVPSLITSADEAAWYKYSATPGQIGASVIEGHVDSYRGPAVFFRLGALRPGDRVDVTLADGITAIFRVTGVREYLKSKFPGKSIYGATSYAALRLITCGGVFDYATGHYLSSTVVFASLVSSRTA